MLIFTTAIGDEFGQSPMPGFEIENDGHSHLLL